MFCGWKEKLQILHWQYGIRLSKGFFKLFCAMYPFEGLMTPPDPFSENVFQCIKFI